MPIDDLNLSMRAYNCLRRSGLMTVGQVLEKGEEELLSLRNFGRKSYEELRDKLNELGLLPAEQPEEVMEAPPLEEGEVPILAQQPAVEEAEAAPAGEEAKVEEEAPAPAAKGDESKKTEAAVEEEEEDVPDWKRKLMELTSEEADQ
jgi:hypothetical protein